MSYYVLDKNAKRVFEFRDDSVQAALTAMGIHIHEEFPYEAAGYEDPYSFMDDYTIITVKDGDVVEVVENV